MSLNPFLTVKSYSEMLTKVATWTFFVSLAVTVVLRVRWPLIDAGLGTLSPQIPVAGVELPLGTLAPAFVMALISRVVKLHDRLSDLLGIRRRFDRQEILLPLAAMSGAILTPTQVERIDAARNNLMGQIFYAYASSDPSKSKIDPHYVTMALDQWSWYWILLEALFVIGCGGAVLFLVGDHLVGGAAAWLVVVGLGTLQLIRSSCRGYAADEIREILKVPGARATIQGVFNAL